LLAAARHSHLVRARAAGKSAREWRLFGAQGDAPAAAEFAARVKGAVPPGAPMALGRAAAGAVAFEWVVRGTVVFGRGVRCGVVFEPVVRGAVAFGCGVRCGVVFEPVVRGAVAFGRGVRGTVAFEREVAGDKAAPAHSGIGVCRQAGAQRDG
jgi:hypothetical protein